MSQTKAQLLGPLVSDNVDVNGDLDFDSGTLKLDPTNNRVGINNSSPTKTLDVNGDITASGDITLKDLNYTADYPTIRPSLDLAFAQTKQLDSRITFTRSSTGTYVGTDGLIKTAAVDTPRFDHDPATGESLGLLIEESRTNDARNSSDFSSTRSASAYGDKSTVNTNVTTAPDGTLTADQIVTVASSTQNRLAQSHSVTSGTYYTYSIFVKYDNLDTVQFYLGYGGLLNTSLTFTFSTETVSGGGGTAAFVKYPNGWYRLSFTGQAFGSGTAYSGFISGTTADQRVYVWGEQIEAGSFPTSHIPTSGSAVTRSADYASITGTNFTNFYNQTEGTFYAEADTINPRYNTNITGYDGNNNNYTVLGTGDSPNRFQLRFDDAYPYQILGFGPNSTNAITSTTPTTTTTSMKIAGAVKQDYVRGYANGESILVDNGFDMISPSALYIGSLNGTSEINPGHIQRIMYYPRVLNNSQLQNITL